MKLMFRLTLSFLIVISFAGLTMAHGRTVEVQARVIAINADGQSLEKPRFNETSSKAINFVPSRGPKFPW